MPKLKTHKGTKKRFRLTSTGKLMRRHAFQSHFLEHKSAKRKRRFSGVETVHGSDVRTVRRSAPYL
ncbi:MAG TPA: 50S ribosomal protein L35 [Candidatus Dormibacteraeota bacterium]